MAKRDAVVDAEEFAARTADVYQRVGAVVLALCGDRSLAEDCAQEALMRAWVEVERGTQLRDLEAWTVRVALNWCRSQLRRASAEQRALRRAGAPSGDGDSSSVDDDVRDAVRRLPFRQREAVVLHYMLDMDIRSMAAATGRSPGAVKNALFNGRKALRSAVVGGERGREPRETRQ